MNGFIILEKVEKGRCKYECSRCEKKHGIAIKWYKKLLLRTILLLDFLGTIILQVVDHRQRIIIGLKQRELPNLEKEG